jgi:hypothetical protein
MIHQLHIYENFEPEILQVDTKQPGKQIRGQGRHPGRSEMLKSVYP